MSTNFVQPGNAVDVVFSADVLSGEPVLVGQIFGIVDHDVDVSVDANGIMNTEGVYSIKRDAADTFTQFGLVYFNTAAKEITTDPDG